MKLKKLCLFLLFFLIVSSSHFSFEVLLNDRLVREWDDSLLPYCYDLPSGRGIPIFEILPLVIGDIDFQIVTEAGPVADVSRDSSIVWKDGCWKVEGFEDEGCLERLLSYGEPLEDRSLQIWLDWEGVRELKLLIQKFAALHDLDLNVQEVPKASAKLKSMVRARGPVPDILMVQSSDIAELVWEEAIQALDYLTTEGLSGLEAFTYEERLWAIPFYLDTQLVFYNRGLVSDSEIRPEWTLEDFEDLSRDPASGGAGWNIYSAYWFIPFQLGFGKLELIEQETLTIVDEPTEKALQYLVDRTVDGTFRVLERDAMISLFTSNRLGIMLSGSYSIPEFLRIGLDFGIAPYPSPLRPILDYKGFAITRKTRNPVLSRRVIEYLTSERVEVVFCSSVSKIPSRSGAVDTMELHPAIEGSLRRGYPVPTDPAYELYKNTMWKLLGLAASGRLDVKTVLEQGQKIIDESLREIGR